jgi:hypothetical protein
MLGSGGADETHPSIHNRIVWFWKTNKERRGERAMIPETNETVTFDRTRKTKFSALCARARRSWDPFHVGRP